MRDGTGQRDARTPDVRTLGRWDARNAGTQGRWYAGTLGRAYAHAHADADADADADQIIAAGSSAVSSCAKRVTRRGISHTVRPGSSAKRPRISWNSERGSSTST
jgi:hypothetical protein